MLIAHLSDLHLSAGPPETAAVRPDAAAVARLVVADILAQPQRPDAVLITGDIADGGAPADYALVRAVLAPLPMPVYVVPGNHDRRGPLRAAFADHPFAPGEALCFEARLGPARVIGLDSQIPGAVEGALCPARLDWLEARLAAAAGPVFLMLHHPPFPTGHPAWDGSGLIEGAGRLEAILRAAPVPVRLLCGHVHQAFHGQWAGGYAAVAGSPAFQFGFGFGAAGEPALIDGPFAWWLHHLRPDGTVFVHPRLMALPPRPDLPPPPPPARTAA